jgi:hypothetical protein
MSSISRPTAWVVFVMCAAALAACSKKKEVSKETAESTTSSTAVPLSSQLTPDNAPYASVIKGKGYTVVQARRFPAQVDSRRAAVVVYRSSDATHGGILYVRGFQDDTPRPVWHWYFADAAPDSVAPVDINRDGLWDARVYMAGGKVVELIQDKDFTLGGAEHDGLIAMNGGSSHVEDMWKAFDADSSTVWKAPSASYIDIPNPLGLSEGQLIVRLSGTARPKKLEIGDGTKKIQDCDLDATSEEQRFQLDAAIKDLPVIRVTAVGPGQSVALSELELR